MCLMGRVLVEDRAAGLGQRVRMLRLDQETAAQRIVLDSRPSGSCTTGKTGGIKREDTLAVSLRLPRGRESCQPNVDQRFVQTPGSSCLIFSRTSALIFLCVGKLRLASGGEEAEAHSPQSPPAAPCRPPFMTTFPRFLPLIARLVPTLTPAQPAAQFKAISMKSCLCHASAAGAAKIIALCGP